MNVTLRHFPIERKLDDLEASHSTDDLTAPFELETLVWDESSLLNAKIYDEVIRVKETDSGPVSKQINQLDGIPVGISSGAIAWAALQLARRPENQGKQIVAIIPSSSERYLSSWLFADINTESDSLDDLLPPA